MKLPDHSTLNRFRNRLMQDNTLEELIEHINQQLAAKNLKVEKAQAAIIDATVIQTASGKLKKAIETNEEEQVVDTPAGKDKDAKWIKKGGYFYLGYKLHAGTDEEGYIEAIHVTPASAAEVNQPEPLLNNLEEKVTVFADKGYDSKDNRELLEEKELQDGIMRKAHRNKPLTKEDTARNTALSKVRYRVEQSFAILHRKFHCKRASYFGIAKVKGQMQLKIICLNLLKAANKLRLVAPICTQAWYPSI